MYNGGMASLSPTAQKIQNLLNETGLKLTVQEFADSTRTAQEAADRVGSEIGQIVKSLVFRGSTTGSPILVLTSGANRVDEKRLSAYVSEPIERADAEFVREVTGFAIGGVPPVGHAQALNTFLDEDLMGYQTIWAAAGTPNAVFELTPGELKRLTHGKIVQVKH